MSLENDINEGVYGHVPASDTSSAPLPEPAPVKVEPRPFKEAVKDTGTIQPFPYSHSATTSDLQPLPYNLSPTASPLQPLTYNVLRPYHLAQLPLDVAELPRGMTHDM